MSHCFCNSIESFASLNSRMRTSNHFPPFTVLLFRPGTDKWPHVDWFDCSYRFQMGDTFQPQISLFCVKLALIDSVFPRLNVLGFFRQTHNLQRLWVFYDDSIAIGVPELHEKLLCQFGLMESIRGNVPLCGVHPTCSSRSHKCTRWKSYNHVPLTGNPMYHPVGSRKCAVTTKQWEYIPHYVPFRMTTRTGEYIARIRIVPHPSERHTRVGFLRKQLVCPISSPSFRSEWAEQPPTLNDIVT